MAKHLKHEFEKKLNWQDKLADRITGFVGSMGFVYFHILWFVAWVALNVLAERNQWDPYPFNFLTMMVSLEAIFLSTFVLISQNREAQQADVRAQLDFEINTKAEKEIEEILRRLKQIEEKLNRR